MFREPLKSIPVICAAVVVVILATIFSNRILLLVYESTGPLGMYGFMGLEVGLLAPFYALIALGVFRLSSTDKRCRTILSGILSSLLLIYFSSTSFGDDQPLVLLLEFVLVVYVPKLSAAIVFFLVATYLARREGAT